MEVTSDCYTKWLWAASFNLITSSSFELPLSNFKLSEQERQKISERRKKTPDEKNYGFQKNYFPVLILNSFEVQWKIIALIETAIFLVIVTKGGQKQGGGRRGLLCRLWLACVKNTGRWLVEMPPPLFNYFESFAHPRLIVASAGPRDCTLNLLFCSYG